MQSNIVQFDIKAAFNWVGYSGLLFKLESIGVGGSALSICREFLSNRGQGVVIDGATSEWIPIFSDVPQGSMLGLPLFILYTLEMFQLVENRLYCICRYMYLTPRYWRLSASQQTIFQLLQPLTRTWLWFKRGAITAAWYCILTKRRLQSLVDHELWTLPSWLGLVCGFHSHKSQLDIRGVKFDRKLTFGDHVHVIASRVSKKVGILR